MSNEQPSFQAQMSAPVDKRGEEHAPPINASSNLGEQEKQKFALENKKMDHEHRQQAGARGWLGVVFGGRDEKAGNIAGLMTLLCFASIAFLLLTADM